MITTLIVDDEPLARQALRRALEPARDIQVIGECGNAIEALARIQVDQPDLVFLDIQMPQVTGIELLGMLDPHNMPCVVFVTAYDEYAVQAFELNGFDYLLKPIAPERLALTLQRVREARPARDFSVLPEAGHLKRIPCFSQHDVIFVKIDDVVCVESRGAGVYVADLEGRERPTELRMNVLETRTPLLRCHRQFLVNVDQVQRMRYLEGGLAEFVTQHGRAIPISRRLLPEIKERLGLG